ncbi:hypothetical protein VNO77_12481 [Canavalia gladiata]|uniref:Uncharacterized protein n=1 Tax=Canavalia gladiata TaxID=3824 RepID=A0AAN9LWX2_CANGL
MSHDYISLAFSALELTSLAFFVIDNQNFAQTVSQGMLVKNVPDVPGLGRKLKSDTKPKGMQSLNLKLDIKSMPIVASRSSEMKDHLPLSMAISLCRSECYMLYKEVEEWRQKAMSGTLLLFLPLQEIHQQ